MTALKREKEGEGEGRAGRRTTTADEATPPHAVSSYNLPRDHCDVNSRDDVICLPSLLHMNNGEDYACKRAAEGGRSMRMRHGYTAETSEAVLCLQMYHRKAIKANVWAGERSANARAGRVGGVK